MENLLRSELYKIRKCLLWKVIIIFYIVTGVLLEAQYILFSGSLKADNEDLLGVLGAVLGNVSVSGSAVNGMYSWFYIWVIMGIMTCLCVVPILTSMYISMEYNTRSIQQMIGKGVSRTGLILSKFIVMVGIINGMILAIAIVGTIINSIVFGFGDVQMYIINGIIFGAKIILLNTLFIAVGSFIGYCFKGSSASMPISFLVIAYVFSSMGDVLVSQNNLVTLVIFLVMGVLFVVANVSMFVKSDII